MGRTLCIFAILMGLIAPVFAGNANLPTEGPTDQIVIADEIGDPDVLAQLASVCAIRGDFERARALYEKARVQYHMEPTVSGRLAVAQSIVSFLKSRQFGDGVPEDALRLLARAKDLLGNDDLQIRLVESEIKGYSSKAEHVQDAYMGYMGLINTFQSLGDSLMVGHCAMRLGRIDGTTGGHRGALENFARAYRIFEAQGDLKMQSWALRNMGHANRKLGHYDASYRWLQMALDTTDDGDLDFIAVRVLNDLSRLTMELGEENVAKRYEKRAHQAYTDLRNQTVINKTYKCVMLDYLQLVKIRYATLLPYETDLFAGFYDQLTVSAK